MSNLIKLEVDIDTLSPSKAAVLSQLFAGLFNCENFPVSAKEAFNETPKTAPKRTSRAKANTSTTSDAFADKERTESVVDEYEAAKEIEVEAEEVKEEQEADLSTAEESSITLDMLQSAMTPDIIDNHRKALKDKVAELGAAKLALLDKSKYPAMLAFLKGLK